MTIVTLGTLILFAAAQPLRDWASRAIDARLAASDPKTGLCRFENYVGNAAKGRFIVNTNFWGRGIDFSCASPWNDSAGSFRAGTAISKRHIVFASHYPLQAGTRILFVGEDGGICPCSIEATKPVGGSDISIGLLNAELTPNIRPAKVLPDDYEKYLGNGACFPVAVFNRQELVFVKELYPIVKHEAIRFMSCRLPMTESRRPFQDKIVVGDSGNPCFLIVGNEAVLLFCLKQGGDGSGPSLHRYRREIQATMDELCPGYRLEAFDFTRLTDRK